MGNEDVKERSEMLQREGDEKQFLSLVDHKSIAVIRCGIYRRHAMVTVDVFLVFVFAGALCVCLCVCVFLYS